MGTKRILVVEDDRDLALGLRVWLKALGYDGAVSTNGAEAIDQMARWQPDLVLLDLGLPDEDGLQVLGRMRANPLFAGIPVVILTACVAALKKVQAFSSGAEAFLCKPVDRLDLQRTIEHVLQAQERTPSRIGTSQGL